MKFRYLKYKCSVLSLAVAALMSVGVVQAATQTHKSIHTFNLGDLVGDFEGTTVGTAGNGSDPAIICGNTDIGSPTCPAEGPQPTPGIDSEQMYPIDSEFGFNVIPFAKSFPKDRGDGFWTEGFIGNISVAGEIVGVELSDAATDTFVVPAGEGRWCTGLGGTFVKCESEHYSVMEHVLTCHETIPYFYADPATGLQNEIEDPENLGTILVDCADEKLDNNLLITNTDSELGDATAIDGKLVGESAFAPDGTIIPAVDWAGDASWADPDNVLDWLEANEGSVLDDIAASRSYSVTAKDDGKPLYRWGNLVKRPNDIRLYARMAVPAPWKTSAGWNANDKKGYRVTKARLIINHKITNNPNDQIRPEDMENEGATGRKPGYDIVDTYGPDSWVSDTTCYEADVLEIPAGTVLKNPNFAIPDSTVPLVWDNNPLAWSSDLRAGLTNAWYTTVDREPFEWSYDTDGDGAADDSYRAPLPDPLPAGTTQLSGPRWRLTPGKFGQDVPGLEIPLVNCAPPPYQKEMIKYEVGELATEDFTEGVGPTIVDLLDWNPADVRSIDGESPLVWSNGWSSNGYFNEGTEVNWSVPIVNPAIKSVTFNGAPVTQGFDLSIYIKGDRKPVALYDARLEIEWDDSPAL